MSFLGTSRKTSKLIQAICDTLRDLVPIEQCKNREKHPRGSVTFTG